MEYKPENGIYMYYYDQTNKKQNNNIQIKLTNMEATHQAMGAKLQKICRDHLFSTTEEN